MYCCVTESNFDYATIAVFCCVAALAITGSLHYVDKDLLGWWLCERQVKSGGLNGRPEKLPDVCYSCYIGIFIDRSALCFTEGHVVASQVCYSWWVLSSLIMIDRVHWIDKGKLVKFILDCQVTFEYNNSLHLKLGIEYYIFL